MASWYKKLFDKITGRNTPSKQVDKVIKQLADFQNSGAASTEDLTKIANTINANNDLVEKKGFGYLSRFAEKYHKNPSQYTTISPTKTIAICISEDGGIAALQKVAGQIAKGEMKSLPTGTLPHPLGLANRVAIMINDEPGPKNRAVGNAIDTLKQITTPENPMKAKEIAIYLYEQYPSIIGIINEQKPLDTMRGDMISVIGGGDSKGVNHNAKQYEKIQKFEHEVKEQVFARIREGTLDTPEGRKYLAKKSIEGLELLKEDLARSEPRASIRQAKIQAIDANISKIEAKDNLVHMDKKELDEIKNRTKDKGIRQSKITKVSASKSGVNASHNKKKTGSHKVI